MTSMPPPPPPPSPGQEFIATPASGLSLWATPDPAIQPSGALPPGAPIRVVDRRGAWAQIQDQSGAVWWVDGRLLPGGGAVSASAGSGGGGSAGKWLIGLVVVAAAAVTVFLVTRDGGSGGQLTMDDLTSEERTVAESASDAIVSGGDWGMDLASNFSADDLGVGQSEFDCMAAGLTRDLGIERMEELGATSGVVDDGGQMLQQLTAAERETVADRAFGCIDFKDMFGRALASDGMDPSAGSCIYDAIGEGTIRNLFVGALSGEEVELEEDDPMVANLFGALTTCLGGDFLGDFGDELGGLLGG